ncbi:MAG: YihY/virulence factor BrkB family protein [Polyangiaceae bacterium]|nr:YihY/virulence factor BrkB family protein [Polyangiaceae bacterium]
MRRHPIGFAVRLVRGLVEHEAFRSAAAVAFWLFFSLVPLLVLVGFLVGLVARRRGVDVLLEPFLQVVPATVEDLVRRELERLAGGGASLAPLGALGYLWSASSGVHNLLDTYDRSVGARPRTYVHKRVVSLAWVVIGLTITCALAWVAVRVDAALRPHEGAGAIPIHRVARAAARHPGRTALESFIGAAITLATGTAGLSTFYRYAVEHPRGQKRRVWPGTLAAVGCWLVVSWAFGVYVASIANYALFYGSLAAVAVLLIWLYLTSLCLMVGIEVNALLEGRRSDGTAPDSSPVAMANDFARVRRGGHRQT